MFLKRLSSRSAGQSFSPSKRSGDANAPGRTGQAPRRRFPVAEAVGLGATAGGAAWSGIGELMHVLPKTLGTMAFGVIGSWVAWKALQSKLQQRKANRHGDQ